MQRRAVRVRRLLGLPPVIAFFSSWAPDMIVDTISSFGFLARFESITKGVVDMRDLLFFVSLIVFALFANAVVIDQRKAV